MQSEITRRHVPTEQNPADLASRSGDVEFQELWRHSPEWMSDSECQSNKLFRPMEQVERKL